MIDRLPNRSSSSSRAIASTHAPPSSSHTNQLANVRIFRDSRRRKKPKNRDRSSITKRVSTPPTKSSSSSWLPRLNLDLEAFMDEERREEQEAREGNEDICESRKRLICLDTMGRNPSVDLTLTNGDRVSLHFIPWFSSLQGMSSQSSSSSCLLLTLDRSHSSLVMSLLIPYLLVPRYFFLTLRLPFRSFHHIGILAITTVSLYSFGVSVIHTAYIGIRTWAPNGS